MNSKQLKAQRRRARQKQNKCKSKQPETTEIHKDPPSNCLWLNKRIQFDQMALNSNGISLKTFYGTIVKVDLCSDDFNDPIITVLMDENTTKSKRIEALLGLCSNTITSKPSDLLNFEFS